MPFFKAKNWKDPDQITEYVKNHYCVSYLNMLVVYKTIKANKHIKDRIHDDIEQERRR